MEQGDPGRLHRIVDGRSLPSSIEQLAARWTTASAR